MLRSAFVPDLDPHNVGETWLNSTHTLELETGTTSPTIASQEYDLVAEDCISGYPFNDDWVLVYRGTLTSASHSETKDIVVKVGLNAQAYEKLRKEGQLYASDKLLPLQGHIVPHCYGAYKVTNGIGDEAPGCLILQDCGEPCGSFDFKDNRNFTCVLYNSSRLRVSLAPCRLQVIRAVATLHDHGLRHRAIWPHHVLDNDGHPFLVGFKHARDHACGRAFREIGEWGEFMPFKSAFKCDELYELCQSSRIWIPSMFRV